MRFEDFDVLLFPFGSHVPIREFRTACFSQQDSRTMTTTPLLTCFVPSLASGAPFQVSVHAWNKPTSILGANNNAGYVPGVEYKWRVKIAVEGATVATDTFAEDVSWPRQLGERRVRLRLEMDKRLTQVVDTASAAGSDGKPMRLCFPAFHRSILAQSHWNACDDLGRIKVQLSAGYEVEVEGKRQFIKLVDHIVFSFQPAPLGE